MLNQLQNLQRLLIFPFLLITYTLTGYKWHQERTNSTYCTSACRQPLVFFKRCINHQVLLHAATHATRFTALRLSVCTSSIPYISKPLVSRYAIIHASTPDTNITKRSLSYFNRYSKHNGNLTRSEIEIKTLI